MTLTDLRLEHTDPVSAPDQTLSALARHMEAMRAERLPDDPPRSLDLLVLEMRHPDPDEEMLFINAWDGDQLVGHAGLFLPLTENTHLAFLNLSVLAPYRHRGLGRRLLAELVEQAGQRKRTRLVSSTSDRLPDGERFARRLGAQDALAGHTNQLVLAELDQSLLADWVARGEAEATDYRVWLNDGAFPEARLAEFADLFNVMNTAPRGDLDMQDWQTTVEHLRHWERHLALTGERRVSAVAEHRATGQLVGFSDLFWHPTRDSILQQGGTGVRPEHRRHGLGRWLKAANLRTALTANPAARLVRTGNADVNAAMLGINHAMGFKPFIASTDWQIGVEEARAALKG